MENKQTNTTYNTGGKRDYYTIDLLHVVKALWHRAWIIILAGILAAGAGFSIAKFAIEPTYSSSIMLYVNNSSFSLGSTEFSFSSSELTAAQSLVKTYSEILNNRTTRERLLQETGLPYTERELQDMISASSANGTEIMRVTVVSENPDHAAQIANCIAEILPQRISEIIDGASMEVVDSAVPNYNKIAPSTLKYTATGLILGVLLAALVLAIIAMLDNTIHDDTYVLQTYGYPILAKVPDLLRSGSKRYGYYSKYQYSQKKSAEKEGED